MPLTLSQELRNDYFLQFRAAYYTQFSIPSYLQSRLTLYKRSVWSANYFLECWEKNVGTIAAGTLPKYNSVFHVEFAKDCSLEKIKLAQKEFSTLQLTLSFRQAPNFPAIVMVDFQRAGQND